jgi:hypothetical protein
MQVSELMVSPFYDGHYTVMYLLQVRNFCEPQSLEGLSVYTMILALVGNALMFPRALLIRDYVWLLGTSWACTAGWGQLLSMFLGTSASG